jgi:hypothetical protein
VTVSPRAIKLWRDIRTIQARGDLSETDLLELRASLNELGRVLGYDGIVIEPHRVAADGRPWRWISEPEHLARWELAKRLADELDAAPDDDYRRKVQTGSIPYLATHCRASQPSD